MTKELYMQRNLTTGSVLKNVLLFSLPYLLSYFLQTLYGMADLFIIGQFEGVASTTAVSIGSQVMRMITVILVGLALRTLVIVQLGDAGFGERLAVRLKQLFVAGFRHADELGVLHLRRTLRFRF